MTKKHLALLLIPFFLCGCSGQSSDEDPTVTEPAGRTVYLHRSATYTRNQSTTRSDYYYNEQDVLTQVVVSDAQGQEQQRYQVTCDSNGNPTEWIAEGTTITCSYDSSGRILQTCTYEHEKLVSSTAYTYSGDLKIQTVTTATDTRRTEYSYDRQNRLQRQDVYTNDTLSEYSLYNHDEEGRLLTEQIYAPDGTGGNLVSYTYFEDCAYAQTTTDPQGNVIQVQSITCDEHGNVLGRITCDGDGVLLSSESHVWMPIQVPEDHPRAGI